MSVDEQLFYLKPGAKVVLVEDSGGATVLTRTDASVDSGVPEFVSFYGVHFDIDALMEMEGEVMVEGEWKRLGGGQ